MPAAPAEPREAMAVVPPPDHGPGWEYLYFASELARGLAAHQAEYLEYQSLAATPSATPVPDPVAHLQALTDEIARPVAKVTELLNPQTTTHAFGPPGQPGDEAAIRDLAAQLAGIYAEMISWGLRVRNAGVGPQWRPVYEALAQYVSLPLHQFQDFSAALSAQVSKAIADLRAGKPPSEPLHLTLTVSIDPAAVSQFQAALATLKSGAPLQPVAAPPPQPTGLSDALSELWTDAHIPIAPYSPPAAGMPTGSPVERAQQLPATAWFHRFGDIPGVDYQTPPGIDPTKLPGYGMEPRLFASDFGDHHLESLDWNYGDTMSSASPAQEWEAGPGDSVEAVLTGCAQGLELPGEPSNYHFMIQGAIERLYKLRRQDSAALPELERLCWLDLALIEAWPRAVVQVDGDLTAYSVLAFDHLIRLYETEGALHEAMDVANIAARFRQGAEHSQELAERIAAVDAEVRS